MPLPSNWNERIRAIVERTKSDKVAAREFTYDPPYREFFPSETIASWPDFDRWISELKGSWCLRGQRNAEWLLSTSLDRAVRIEHQTENSSGFYHLPRLPIEQEYLFKFRQQAQNWGLRISLRTALWPSPPGAVSGIPLANPGSVVAAVSSSVPRTIPGLTFH